MGSLSLSKGSFIISLIFFTKNGRGAYAIVDISEYENYEKTKAALRLMCELQKGRLSGEQKGWLSEEDVEKHFEEKFHDLLD